MRVQDYVRLQAVVCAEPKPHEPHLWMPENLLYPLQCPGVKG